MNYYDTYSYTTSAADSILAGILAIYFIVLLVFFLFYVISYVFKGIGMYTIAKRQGMDYPWLAFIPFARTYLHGELAGRISLKNKGIKNPGIWLLVMPFIFGAVNFVFYMILWAVGIGAFADTFTGAAYGYQYGYSDPHVSTGLVMGLIILAVIWMITAVLYGAVYKVLGVLVNHQILERFTTKNMSVAHAVLSTLIPLYESICLFVMRNKDYNPGMEPDLGRPFMQMPPPVMPPQGGPAPYRPDMAVPPVAPVPHEEPVKSAEPVVDAEPAAPEGPVTPAEGPVTPASAPETPAEPEASVVPPAGPADKEPAVQDVIHLGTAEQTDQNEPQEPQTNAGPTADNEDHSVN